MTDLGPRDDIGARDDRLELSAPATPEILELVHAMLEHLWTTHEVADAHRVRFETSVIEILGNIIEHAFAVEKEGGSGRRFDIMLCVGDDDLVARLGDNGVPIELDLSGAVMPDPLAESGRGLALATAALDSLSFDHVDGRNIWDLVLLRRSEVA